ADPAQAPHTALDIDETRTLSEVTERLVQQVERTYLQKLLKRHAGHMAATAKAAGITRRTLYTKMKQYSLEAADFRHR
ncbi:MAG: helix-turn-helix domain-containing protein, partial [SAR324 cluster bacterium]|nr:helix-turn-helix domain-containing protein [SAR324 cluster bacterium]